MTQKQTLKEMVSAKKSLKYQNEDAYLDSEDFVLFCYIAKTPQSYGSILERRIRIKNNMTKVDASDERGDVVDSDGLYKEIKCSLSDNGIFNAVQIRPHHNIHSCLMFFFEIDENQNVINHIFEVPENDLTNFPGFSVAHGVTKNKNSKTEYRITFDKNPNKLHTVAGKAWSKLQSYKVEKNF